MGSVQLNNTGPVREPIAIVGSSCRLPGSATSPSKLWELLKNPRDISEEVPSSRFDANVFYHQDSQHHGSTNTRNGYLLQDEPRLFDRDFFNISPKEAEAMDPQQRNLLEIVYEGVESAGYSIPQLQGSATGVFVGVIGSDFQYASMRGYDSLPQYFTTGGSQAILANRISYFFDWRGSSSVIDAACSSSLVALHQAVLALRSGEIDMAAVAGSNLILGPELYMAYSNLNMLSPSGRSRMWDSSADGYGRGEGFTSVIIKTLSQAIADGDHIECIIRETGVNQDGRTPGITMPGAESQAQLIRDPYMRCGLDPVRDRPQFFEAHGTGTPAGDPIEAQAIHDVFFPGKPSQHDGQLLIGSIKTVVGHTEGCSGIAGLLKALLAVQHGQIPPNLHFRELNPKIEPFYERLRVPTALTPCPALPNGEPRRASVNSFGFGGTNAHVVIESWNRAPDRLTAQPHPGGLFVLSANSAQALTAKAAALAGYLRENPETNLVRLGRTLFRRGDFFLFRAAFSAISAAQLIEKLEARIEVLKKTVRIPAIPKSLPPRILGVFTGQGAQWATMGKELYETSSVFRKAINRLQQSLDTLPDTDRPNWKLIDELSASKGTSRVGIASISQPICTALQIALVDTLRAAGVNFAAVVGHSSGEIAAAYTAGYLDARDAIRVAYYRGFHAKLAQGSDGKRGKMMAVGLGFEAASNFCSEFGLKVAASNSPTSCTLAGDAVLIDEAKERLDQDKIFARALAVDTAYHSHHMLPCAEPYLESLRKCGVKAQAVRGPRNCQWYSSVWGPNGRSRSFDSEEGLRLLDGQYWVDNLTNTVQFSQAVSRALSEESSVLDLVLEVGPHPALKGPSSEVIKSLTGLNLPYGGVLQRGQSAVEAFADCLGLLWTAFPSPRPLITFSGLLQALPLDNPKEPSILKDLPTYPWDHDSLNWRESRANRMFRNGPAPHELLGRPNVLGDKGRREVHWRQVFKLSELPWVRGHTIQGEVIFPGTGYVAMAYEAAVRLVDDQQALQLFELHDIEIVRAMSMQGDSPGLEVVFTVRVTSETDSCITADVACYSGDITMTKLDGPVNVLNHTFSGGVRLFLGPAQEALSTRKEPLLPMTSLDMGQLYTSLSKVGYNYSDHFVARAVDRHLGRAVVSVSTPPESSAIRACVHPVVLDTAIQGHLSALAYPEDGRLGTTYLATGIDCVRINMTAPSPDVLKADSVLLSSDAKALKGDVDLFDVNDGTVQIQMLGVQWTALNQPKERWLYAGEVWARDAADGIELSLKTKFSPEDEVLRKLLVRTAHFYLRRLRGQIKPSELILMNKHRRHMMKWVREHLFPQIEAGKLPDFEPGWANDTLEDVQQWSAPYLAAGNNDMLILHATGNNLLAIARGTMPPLQVLLKDDMLDRLYVEGVGFADGNLDLEILVKQLAHRYPRMKVLEVGAGTGGTTRAALSAMRDQYASYMYTDISAGFFENAKTKFSEHASKMSFKILNIEKDPVDQAFDEGAYDMVIASNALHATRSMKDTLGHCRRLLRPGGFLVLLEITINHLPIQLIMGTLPGWWLGIDEGRVWQPTLSLDEWDRVLQEVGFSGVDTSSTPSFCSVIMSQATNETFQTLREPLSTASSPSSRPLGHVLVVGDIVSELASKSQALIASYESVHQCDLAGLEAVNCPPGAVMLSLCDLESPVFEQMTEAKFEAIRTIFSNASAVLWVTTGAATGKSPMANITVGLGRILLAERSDLRLQFLDVDDTTSLEPSLLADLLLKLTAISQPDPSDILWTHEPHLELRDGVIYIPRVLPLDSINRHSTETAVELMEQDTADQITTDDAGPAEQNGTFASDKTYILFGMTGDVGISIARWMVENGARNVVLTSRHPDVPAGVFEFMSQKGAVLRAVGVDVTDKEGLRKAFSEIKSSMPPIIGGIINGAMVLRDRPFADTPWEDFEAVLAPKVAGTRNLDELFGASEEALDFFIVLSSATSFVGISGQSSYSAANHYMSSLVRSRRARGLAGSVVVIGFLTGMGYIYRSDPKHLATIEKSLLPRLDRQGETDLHDMLLKAIECGRPDSAQPSELVTGIRRTFTEPWHKDPRLSGYLVPEGAQDEGGDGQDEAEGNIKVDVQLAAVEGEDPKEGLAVLIKCFSKVLGNVLQLDPTEISSDVPVVEHGVDSLVSVRIREWFLKDLGVDVPVLKLMSTNHTLSRLCEDALASWRKLRPGYGGATGSESQAQPAANKDPDFDWKKEVDGMLDGIAALAPPQIPADADADAGAENNNADPPRTSARRVVLTGCTGFLGTHMLRALVADNDVAEVHCLCLRSRPLRVQDPKKIRQYKGDLGNPQLGLSVQAFKRLSQTADLIIHVGADVAHLKSYQQMRAANVVSTQYLLAMATPRSVPVHFISSSAVAMLQKDTSELAEVLPSSFGPPADAESLMKNAIGYAASKWIGEILVERAARVPGVVHRFPNIVGPDAPEEIPLIALNNFCTRMRAVPALDPKQWVGELDIIDVRDVVPEFLARACAHDPREPVAVHNYCSENRYLLSDLVSMYKARLGGRIDVLPTKEWMNRAIALGMPKGVEATFTGTEVFVSPVLRKGRTL